MYWFSKLYVCLQGEIYYYYLLDKFISVIIYQIYLSYLIIIIVSFFLFQPEGRSTIPILVILIDCLPFHKFPKCFHPCVTFDLFNKFRRRPSVFFSSIIPSIIILCSSFGCLRTCPTIFQRRVLLHLLVSVFPL